MRLMGKMAAEAGHARHERRSKMNRPHLLPLAGSRRRNTAPTLILFIASLVIPAHLRLSMATEQDSRMVAPPNGSARVKPVKSLLTTGLRVRQVVLTAGGVAMSGSRSGASCFHSLSLKV